MVQARIQKWGNSLAVRIPKPFALDIGLAQNSLVSVSVVGGKLLLEPVKSYPSLNELLAGVTQDNLHQEFETGAAVGNEAW